MIIRVFIEPHERYDALEAYGDRLTPAQIAEIKDAPESALISLKIDMETGNEITIVEEG